MNSGMNQDNSSNPRPGALPFLLEIGSEEIPARFIPGAMADIERLAKAGLQEAHLSFTGCRVMATPRRLTLMVEGLAERQPDRPLEVKGPPVSVAFDADGNPTPAAQGFARKVGVDLDQCERGEDQRGEFLLVRKTEVGRPAAEVLAEIIPGVVLGIPFRKVMRWGDRDLEYPRPCNGSWPFWEIRLSRSRSTTCRPGAPPGVIEPCTVMNRLWLNIPIVTRRSCAESGSSWTTRSGGA
jgi:hypothetical protein